MEDNKNKNKPFTKFKKCIRKLKFTKNKEYELDFNKSLIDKYIDDYFMYHVHDEISV